MPEAAGLALGAVLFAVLVANTVDAVGIAAIRSHVRALLTRDHHGLRFVLEVCATVRLAVCLRRTTVDCAGFVLWSRHGILAGEEARSARN